MLLPVRKRGRMGDVARVQLFDKKVRKAHATMVLNLKDSQLMHVSSASSAKEVWERLQDYEAKGLANRLFLRRKLFTCQMIEGDTMIAHINKVKAMGESSGIVWRLDCCS